MKYIYLFFIIGLVSCESNHSRINKHIEKAKKNIDLFKGAKNEILNSKEFKNKTSITFKQLQQLLSEYEGSKFNDLKALIKKELLCSNRDQTTICITNAKIDFHIWNSDNLIWQSQTESDIISFDKHSTWEEAKSVIGQVDDTGFNELLELERHWYFVSTWDKE